MSDRTAETPTPKLDPAAALRDALRHQLHEVRLIADDGARRMVEDFLLERAVVLGVQNVELREANTKLTELAGEMSAANESLLAELAAQRDEADGSAK